MFQRIVFLVVLLVLLLLVAMRMRPRVITGGRDRHKNLKEFPASRLERGWRDKFEKITGQKFPCILPSWLTYRGKSLELDGYNSKMKIAFEVQGPQHTMFDKKWDKDYQEYYNRLVNDKVKRLMAQREGIALFPLDYRIPQYLWGYYTKSRIYDACKADLANCESVPILKEKPPIYIEEIIYEPHRNKLLEEELGLQELDTLEEALSKK